MARSIHGNLTGQAAHLERLDLREEIEEHRRLFSQRWDMALEKLKEIDPGWEPWYDNRPEKTCREMLPLIENRIHSFTLAREAQSVRTSPGEICTKQPFTC